MREHLLYYIVLVHKGLLQHEYTNVFVVVYLLIRNCAHLHSLMNAYMIVCSHL